MAQLNFNATQVAPDAGQMDPIPAGWHNVVMDQSEMKPTKDGMGSYLECRFNIVDGPYYNRKVYSRLNLQNANVKAVEIALAQLSAIAHAVNVLHVQDSSQLHNIPLKIKVKLRAATEGYEASNEIAAYKNINEVVSAAPQAPQVPQVPQVPQAPAYQQVQAPAHVPVQAPVYQAPAPEYQPQAAAPVYHAQDPNQLAPQPWQNPAQNFAAAPPAAPAFNPQAQPQAPQAFTAAPPPGVTFPGGAPQQAPQAVAPQQPSMPAPGQGEVPPWLKPQA